MGWASGFRAGSELGESIIDTYRSARKNRDIKEIEAGLQRQQGDATAEQETQQANIQVMAGQQPGQAQQQQLARNAGLAPAINPQQSMVAPPGQQLAGRATNVPAMGQMSPVGSEAMGLGPAARGPMSEADLNAQRALALRARGYTDEADKADAQARLLRQDERQLARDAIADARAMRGEQRQDTRLGLDVDRAERERQAFEQQTELFGYKLKDAETADKLRTTIDSFADMSPNEVMTSKEYQALSPTEKNAVAGLMAGVTSSELEASNAFIKQQLSALRTDQDVLDFVNQDESITAGTSYVVVENEDGSVSLQYQTDGGEVIGQPKPFDNETQALSYLRQLVQDPGTAAVYYETVFQGMERKASAIASANRDNAQFAISELNKLQVEFLDPDGVWATMERNNPDEFRKVQARVFAPFVDILGQEAVTELIGAKSNVTEEQSSGILNILGLSTGDTDDASVQQTTPPPTTATSRRGLRDELSAARAQEGGATTLARVDEVAGSAYELNRIISNPSAPPAVREYAQSKLDSLRVPTRRTAGLER